MHFQNLNICFLCSVVLMCGKGTDQTVSMPILTDAVTLELKFGDEVYDNEFLLAKPRDLAVNNAGDIYVMDENKLKVFDPNGGEKTIIGREGDGPNEFQSASLVEIGPGGYIAAGRGAIANFYKPDNLFINQVRFRNSAMNNVIKELNFSSFIATKIIMLNENETVQGGNGNLESGPQSDITRTREQLLIHFKDDTLQFFAEYESTNELKAGFLLSYVSFLGELYWNTVLDDRVVYTHTGYDKHIEPQKSNFTLHLLNYRTSEESEIVVPYNPVEYPDSLLRSDNLNRVLERISISGDINDVGSMDFTELLITIAAKLEEKLKEEKYYPPVAAILADGHYIFAFAYDKDYSNPIALVIDADSGDVISKVLFPAIPEVIKNGYAYVLKTGQDIFPVVEKYKIDPAVYGN